MEYIKVSIITVCYNSASTIEQTIQSVLSQSYTNIEYIIIDGGSTDSTVEIIKRYLLSISVFISEADEGIYDAMNKGIKNATGDIIGILNSDDIFFNNKVIEKVADAFSTHKTDIVYGDIVMHSSVNKDTYIRRWIAGEKKSFTWGWHPPHPGLFVKKTAYNLVGHYNVDYNVSADFDLMLRLFEVHKMSSFYLNYYLVSMQLGGESTGSLKKILTGNTNIRKSFKSNKILYFFMYSYLRIVKKLLQYF